VNRFVPREQDYAFGQLMLTLRTAIGLTQTGLAEFLGVSRRAVGGWEAGNSYPKSHHLKEFIALAVRQQAFPGGHEEEEIRALWRTARQKVLLDDAWLSSLLADDGYRGNGVSASPITYHLSPITYHPSPGSEPRLDWGDALSVSTFYGREWELDLLAEWVVEERCQVVSVLGLGGVGKSALAVRLMQQLAPRFEAVIWRSVRNALPCRVLIEQCLQVLAPQALGQLPDTPGVPAGFEQTLNLLLEQIRDRRVLLVLDNLETLLEEGDEAGRLRAGYEDYGLLLRQVAETRHQSCLLFTSREKPGDLVPLEGSRSPVRVLRLARLDAEACEQLLAESNVTGSGPERARLVEAYTGNPLALKIVAQTIVDLFDGEIAPFLAQDTLIFGGVRELLAQQFDRLSPLERNIMFWLAIMREPVTFDELRAAQVTPVPRIQLLEAMEALRRRSLVERGGQPGTFTLQSVVLEYVTARLVTEASDEIMQGFPAQAGEGRLMRLIDHSLTVALAPEYVRQTQERLIVAPVLEHLQGAWSQAQSKAQRGIQATLADRLAALLNDLRAVAEDAQGYGPANLAALLIQQQGDLHAVDLSGLMLRSAYLQGVEMQDASLSGASIRDSVFAETFDSILAVAISGDGNYMAACSLQGDIRMWSIPDYALQRIWASPKAGIYSFALSPDGRTVAGGDWGGMVHLWDVATGALLWSSGSHTNMINSLLFTPDGSLIASCSDDATVRLWDARSGEQLQILEHPTVPHHVAVPAIACGPNQHLLASSDSEGRIYLWALHGTNPATLVRTIAGHTGPVTGLAFSPDESTLASASWDGTVKLWAVPEGRLLETLPGDRGAMSRVAWSPDGYTLACGGHDNMVWLWSVEDAAYRSVLRGRTGRIRGMAFTPDSRTLLSGGDDGTLRLWDVHDGRCTHVMQGYRLLTSGVTWSPDGKWLAGAGSDLMLTIYDAEGVLPPRLLSGHRRIIAGWNWSPDSRRVASCEKDNIIRIWDIHSGECQQVLHYPDDPANIFNDVDWSPDGRWLAATSTRHGVMLWDMAGPQERLFREMLADLHIVHWNPDGTRLACSDSDGHVVVLDPAQGVVFQRLGPHPTMISSIAWSPLGTMLVLGCNTSVDGAIFVWDVEQEKIVRTVTGEADLGFQASWGADEHEVISGGSDGKLRWWNVETGECVRVVDAHREAIHSVGRSRDGTRLATCGQDGDIVVWDIRTGEYLRTMRRDRPYERLDITGIKGLTEAQKATLRALGAIEDYAGTDRKG
jgi:WD40 repeat protein/transcriptional regulator with XRE-family HTH domain